MTERFEFGIDYIFKTEPFSLEDLSIEEEREVLHEVCGECFRDGVEFLKNKEAFPNERINELMFFTWCLFSRGVITMSLTDSYSLGLWLSGGAGQETVSLLIPKNFVFDCQEFPTEQLGSIIVTSSYLQDFLNDRLKPLEEAKQRTRAYLAEFLQTRQTLPPTFVPDKDEKVVLRAFPEGLNSLPPQLRYEPAPLPPAFLALLDPYD